MAKIKIPEQYLKGLDEIRLLNESDFTLLCDTLRGLPKGVGHRLFIQTINEAMPLENSDVIAEAIFSFGGLLIKDNFDSQDTARDIASSYNSIQDAPLADEQLELLEDRIALVLLNAANIKLTFEAYDIISSSQNVIVRTSIQTDVRMLFEKDSISNSRNGLIFFNLKLVLQHDNDYKTDVFTLDHDDLLKLRTQIEDILSQQEAIRTKHKDVINFIDITE